MHLGTVQKPWDTWDNPANSGQFFFILTSNQIACMNNQARRTPPMVKTVLKKKAVKAKTKVEVIEGEIMPVKKGRPANSGKKTGTLSGKMKKTIALAIDHGVEPKEAYMLVNGKVPTPATATRVKQMVEKYSLQRPVMQKLANQAIKDTLEGKEARYDAVKVFSNGAKVPYQEVIAPSYTNKLAAAAMIYDRIDPLVRRSENLNVNVDCSPVDLAKYRNR